MTESAFSQVTTSATCILQCFSIVKLHKSNKYNLINIFQFSVTFHIEISFTLCNVNQMTGFFMTCNTEMKLVKFISKC